MAKGTANRLFGLLNQAATLKNRNLKIRDLAKLWFFKLIMTKLNLKIAMTSFRWRYRHYVTIFSNLAPPPNQNFCLLQCTSNSKI